MPLNQKSLKENVTWGVVLWFCGGALAQSEVLVLSLACRENGHLVWWWWLGVPLELYVPV